MNRPGVGVGVIILNDKGQILVGRRKGSHARYFSIPGGHLENGETFEEAAIKEVYEETTLKIFEPKVFCVTNNIETFKAEGLHYISVCLYTDRFSGSPIVTESEKCESWIWVSPKELPEPHFEASRNAVKCFLEKKFYMN